MYLRNAYILSGVLHVLIIALVLATSNAPRTKISSVQFHPVRLIAPSGRPGIAASQIKAGSEVKPQEEAKPKVNKRAKVEPPGKGMAKKVDEAGQASRSKQSDTNTAAGQGGSGGTTMRLDGANFPYPYYLNNIQIKILANFKPAISPKQAIGLKAVVYFVIDQSGKISEVKLEEKSGQFLFDQEAQRAVLRSNPLPALPPAFGSDRLGVHFEFVASQ
ncbi:MAG: TonB family protein [bacterium]|nr:TonB family protein [bacterium]